MTPVWTHPIWNTYQSHGDVDQLREDVLTTPWYRTPLKLDDSLLVRAVESCDVAAVKVLIELGESPALPTSDGFPALHIAVDEAYDKDESPDALELVGTLLQHGADPNVHGNDGTSLHRAAGGGLVAVVDVLLRHGADIEARTRVDGELTPLMHAALMNQPNMVRHLLKNGADASARCAEYMGHLTTAELVEKQDGEKATVILSVLRG
jgi:ankyrin repeat protein